MCNQALPNNAITLYGASGPPLLRRMVDDICRKVSGRPTGRENNVIAYVIQPEYLLSYLKRINSGYLSRDWKKFVGQLESPPKVFSVEKSSNNVMRPWYNGRVMALGMTDTCLFGNPQNFKRWTNHVKNPASGKVINPVFFSSMSNDWTNPLVISQ